MRNKMKQKYSYEIGKIYLYNLKKIFEDNLVVGLTASKKRSLKNSFKKKGHQKRSLIEIYLDADKNEDRNSQGGSLLL